MKLDLEVSEPIDFGSGDHQHLIRKAADKSIQSESGEHYTPSSSAGPQETREKPRPKDTEQLNTYVIEISDDITPGDSNAALGNPFSDASVRRAFIIKVFLLLSVQLLLTAVITSVFIFWEALRVWVLKNPWFIYATFPAFFAVLIILACCGNLRRQVPANYILLGFFTALEGLLLGAISVFYKAEEVLWATAATTLVTLALTLFALQTKWDFTLLNGVLFVFCFVLFIYGIILIFVQSYWLHLLYAGLGTVLFSLYLVMDVQLMLGGHHHYSLDPEEYVFAALNIYLDIINLFIFILRLIGLGR
ncbi:protein lifeguard 1-like isoform X3 [Trachypithecus francoisi]|uniref:protein lifeguard 1-like isoform X3 n=1 Tax=Trachypithecus francoisi TaxID=54180 RepID=UPI00141B0F1B|nr:protein lifeguard 1-like isoform X3 [Trachypithecus francoisi]